MKQSPADPSHSFLPTRWVVPALIAIIVIGLLTLIYYSAHAQPKPNTVASQNLRTAIALTNEVVLLLQTSTPNLPPTPVVYLVEVHANQYPFENTMIQIHVGDSVEITVHGQNPTWQCSQGDQVSPTGYDGQHLSNTVYYPANLCALIGSVSSSVPDVYFGVGAHLLFQATKNGNLYLGCNDATEKFVNTPFHSMLQVQVTVKK